VEWCMVTRKARILVVGDKLNLPLFRSAGLSVREAENEEEVLEAIRSAPRDTGLVIVLKHVVRDPTRVVKEAEKTGLPVLVLPTPWSPAEKINVEKLLAKALGLG